MDLLKSEDVLGCPDPHCVAILRVSRSHLQIPELASVKSTHVVDLIPSSGDPSWSPPPAAPQTTFTTGPRPPSNAVPFTLGQAPSRATRRSWRFLAGCRSPFPGAQGPASLPPFRVPSSDAAAFVFRPDARGSMFEGSDLAGGRVGVVNIR